MEIFSCQDRDFYTEKVTITLFEPVREKTNNLGSRPGPTQNRAVQLQMERGWKFWI